MTNPKDCGTDVHAINKTVLQEYASIGYKLKVTANDPVPGMEYRNGLEMNKPFEIALGMVYEWLAI